MFFWMLHKCLNQSKFTTRQTKQMRIFVTHRFHALHKWDSATGLVSFLRHEHRHLFFVRLEIEVTDDDRQIEFLGLQSELEVECERLKQIPGTIKWSCEHYARAIGEKFNADLCEVSEDNENGAIWKAK